MTTSRNVRFGTVAASLLGFAVLVGPAGQAWAGAPIQDIENVPVPDGLDMSAIGTAIIDGCATRNWVASEVGPGHLQCTLYIRSHMAKVDIRYDTETFSITYADSDNLKYDAKDHEIHRNYNSWVQNLNGDIRTELLKASR